MRAFVIFRDRLSYGSRCVAALMMAGLDVTVVDHGSTFAPAVDWLSDLEIPVWYHGGGNPRELWNHPDFRAAVAGERYVVTDPDVVPDDGCPTDWPQHLSALLDVHGQPKIGLGLRIDDIPDHYPRKRQVLDWEGQYWQREIVPGLYDAGTDTTLAVCQPLGGGGHTIGGARTGPPYVANHLAWYENPEALPEDVAYYYSHTEPGITFWSIGSRSAWGDLK